MIKVQPPIWATNNSYIYNHTCYPQYSTTNGKKTQKQNCTVCKTCIIFFHKHLLYFQSKKNRNMKHHYTNKTKRHFVNSVLFWGYKHTRELLYHMHSYTVTPNSKVRKHSRRVTKIKLVAPEKCIKHIIWHIVLFSDKMYLICKYCHTIIIFPCTHLSLFAISQFKIKIKRHKREINQKMKRIINTHDIQTILNMSYICCQRFSIQFKISYACFFNNLNAHYFWLTFCVSGISLFKQSV